MKPFKYERATDTAGALAAVVGHPGTRYLAGGTNLVDHMKLGIDAPDRLVDITHLPLDAIEESSDGALRLGAMVRNSDLAAHPLVRWRYPVLSQALLSGASGQLRNAATTGGNLLQRTRCVYFQDASTPCNKREPGTGCSALHGYTRYHAILGASAECVAVNPSDMSVALAALDARVIVLGTDGERGIDLTGFHRLPGDEPDRDTVLEHGELITAVELPALPTGTRSAYRKVRDRASYAFALVSVAAVVEFEDDGGARTGGSARAGARGGERTQVGGPAPTITSVRLALGGVAHKPWRATLAEEVLRGMPATRENIRRAMDAELEHARSLRDNSFKIAMVRNTATAVLRDLAAGVVPGPDTAPNDGAETREQP